MWKFVKIIRDLRSIKEYIDAKGQLLDLSFRNLSTIKRVAIYLMTSGVCVIIILPPPPPLPASGGALKFLSREGRELRQLRDERTGAWAAYRSYDEFPEHVKHAVIEAEDSRFGYHPGVDPLAIVRAFFQNLHAGRIVSGASTIHQQVARLHPGIHLPSSPFLRKPVEAWYAMRLALWNSSDSILECYLNLVPLKWNSQGIPVASVRILGKEMTYLTPEESAVLAILIRRSTTGRVPFRARYAALAEKLGIDPSLPPSLESKVFAKTAATASHIAGSFEESSRAPHFIDRLLLEYPGIHGEVRTTISDDWNEQASRILASELEIVRKKGAFEGAVVALERKKDKGKERFETVIYVGSSDYSGEEGQVDGARARRNAGSTLKPFVYALSMDELGLGPFSILSDREISVETGDAGETYRPLNYDLNYWGDISLRESLVTSRNIPAVDLAQKVGTDRIYNVLQKLGMSVEGGPDQYGPGIALGITGTSVMELARAYSVFVSGGELRPLRLGSVENGDILEWDDNNNHSIFSERAAYWITDILSDRETGRRAYGDRSFLDFPFDVAAKTGTSKDFRDSWTVGYTDRFVVAVWVGDFHGGSMNRISGVYGAGRIFHQVIRMLEEKRIKNGIRNQWKTPIGWNQVEVCAKTGCPAPSGNSCMTVSEAVPAQYHFPDECQTRPLSKDPVQNNEYEINQRRILSPSSGETYIEDPHVPRSALAIPLHILGCNGCRYRIGDSNWKSATKEIRQTLPFHPGKHTIELIGPDGYREKSNYSVEGSP